MNAIFKLLTLSLGIITAVFVPLLAIAAVMTFAQDDEATVSRVFYDLFDYIATWLYIIVWGCVCLYNIGKEIFPD